MESHDILKNAFSKSSPKAIASELGVSLSLVYKWAQNQSESGSGSRNPIDRVIKIREMTDDEAIVEYIAEQCGGYFVKNPVSQCMQGFQYLPATTEIVTQFSNLLARISTAALDNSITSDEAEDIRHCWDKLKSYAEGFVRCCEEGDFERMEEPKDAPEKMKAVRKTLY